LNAKATLVLTCNYKLEEYSHFHTLYHVHFEEHKGYASLLKKCGSTIKLLAFCVVFKNTTNKDGRRKYRIFNDLHDVAMSFIAKLLKVDAYALGRLVLRL